MGLTDMWIKEVQVEKITKRLKDYEGKIVLGRREAVKRRAKGGIIMAMGKKWTELEKR